MAGCIFWLTAALQFISRSPTSRPDRLTPTGSLKSALADSLDCMIYTCFYMYWRVFLIAGAAPMKPNKQPSGIPYVDPTSSNC